MRVCLGITRRCALVFTFGLQIAMNGTGTGELVVLTANEVVLTKIQLVMPAPTPRRLRHERLGALIGQNDLLWRCD